MSFFHEITGPLYPVLDWPMNTGKNGAYNFFSGFGGGCILVSYVTVVLHTRCAKLTCWRHGKHPTADGMHKLCRVHHPDLPNRRLPLHEIHLRHHAHKEKNVVA